MKASTIAVAIVSALMLSVFLSSIPFLSAAPQAAFAQRQTSRELPQQQEAALQIPVNTDTGGEEIPLQYIVMVEEQTSLQATEATVGTLSQDVEEQGAQVLAEFDRVGGFVLRAPDQETLEESLAEVQASENVAVIEQDQTVVGFNHAIPSGINRADADLSAAKSGDHTGSVSIDIAVIDTGIDLDHPMLNVYQHVSFAGTPTGDDDNGHGTHVAGIAAAKDNGGPVVGVAPEARLWAVKVLDGSGSGSMSAVIAGVEYVTQHANEIDVVNMSLGCECTSAALDTAISNSVAAGVTYVVAAANSNKDASTFSPANHPSVIAVSSISDTDGKCGGSGQSSSYGPDDAMASYSNYGSVVDMAAPGTQIYSTYPGGTYATLSGTSMAAPHVAGAVALYKSQNPSATPAQVYTFLKDLGSMPSNQCDDNGHGYFTADKDQITEPLLYLASSTPPTQPPPPPPAQPPATNIIHRILQDNSDGNSKGWNPDGSRRIFTIYDSAYNPATSVVVVNTRQANFVICQVDYWYNGAFEVYCNVAPSNGGILNYDIINTAATSSTSTAAAASEEVQQEAQQRAQSANRARR